MIFVVYDKKNGKMWVFDTHDAALACRRAQKLNHWSLWGCATNAYLSMQGDA